MPKKMTLLELQTSAATMGEAVQAKNDEYQSALVDTSMSREKRDSIKEELSDLQDRFDGINASLKQAREAQQQKFRTTDSAAETAKDKQINKYAEMIRSVYKEGRTINGADFSEAMTISTTQPGGDNNGNGEAFLPINVASDMISEPFKQNPLRNDASFSQIVNLILPRIDVEFGDAFAPLADGAAAKEADIKGSQIKFSRFESKVRIGLSASLLAGSPAALVEFVNSALLNGVSQYELSRAFATTPAEGEEHMSFYDASNAIKHVDGTTDLYVGIKRAIADMDDAFADNVKIYMTKPDYYDIIEKLANNSVPLYGAQPEEVLGAPVVFTSKATTPVVGDFSQYHANYDPTGSLLEQYKDYPTGINYFQVTSYYDAQIKLTSAFRLVDKATAATDDGEAGK